MSSAPPVESNPEPPVSEAEAWLGDPRATRLERRRVRLGLSVQGLAALADVSRKTVSGVEGRKHVPSTQTITRLARALQCTVEELIEPDWS
jgi:transcriptional regulator with XRE-family HTH domain